MQIVPSGHPEMDLMRVRKIRITGDHPIFNSATRENEW